MRVYLIAILSALCFCGCYRMPEEGEVSTVPNTNNPTVNRQSQNMMPGVEY